jgi:Putative inner membrane protein (DUF1819)
MTRSSRANVASSFTIKFGALVDETYALFSAWDFARSKRENLDRLREENYIGASSATWLRDIAKVLNRRFDPSGRDRSLVLLAKLGLPMNEWKPLLLWHITRDEFLLRDFLENWLFAAYASGMFRVRTDDVLQYLSDFGARGGVIEHEWSVSTKKRVAAGLLKIAVDFGLLRGSVAREFASFHLSERSFLYLLHAMREASPSPAKLINSPAWRMFLLHPSDVEHELLRLHQYRRLDYQVAGSLVQLSLPCASSVEFAERMVA